MNRVTVAEILAAVAAEWGVPIEALLGGSKRRAVVQPRQVVMWLARFLSPLSDRAVAVRLRRDRRTCDFGVARVQQRMSDDPTFLIRVHALERRLREQARTNAARRAA